MTEAGSMFLYWCRACSAWWDAQIPDVDASLLRRRQRSSTDKPGVWNHPGMAVCPSCGEPSTQHLPTEHSAAAAVHRNPQFRITCSERVSLKDVQVAVSEMEAPVAVPA